MKKKNVAIIAAIALVLAVAIGYALFSQEIQINGTATAKGNFDVVFQLAAEGDDSALAAGTCNAGFTRCTEGAYTQADVAVLSNNNHLLTVTVDKLAYEGAEVTIPFRVKNIGTIDAKLIEITQSKVKQGTQAAPEVISVEYTGLATTDSVLEAGKFYDGVITVSWPTKEGPVAGNSVDETIEFTVRMNYQQAQ